MTSSTTEKSGPDHEEEQEAIIIFDGGTGREIERCGGPFRQPEWSALALYERPEVVRTVHERFLKAGATAITTNTYAICPFHIGEERYQKDAKWLLRLAVDISHDAISNYITKHTPPSADGSSPSHHNLKILGSIPPLCGSYEPEKFSERVANPIMDDFLEVLGKDNRVDILLLETVGSLREAQFYLRRIREFYKQQQHKDTQQRPVWLSFCTEAEYGFDQKPTLLSGETISDAITTLSSQGGDEKEEDCLLSNVDVILVNCCDIRLVKDSIQEIQDALSRASSSSSFNGNRIRMGAYPNAFSIPPPDAANHTLRQVDYNITPEFITTKAKEWNGATVLGGCCGVGPEHIHALTQLRDRNSDNNNSENKR